MTSQRSNGFPRRSGRRVRNDALRYALTVLALSGLVISAVLLFSPPRPLATELVVATDHSPPFQIIQPDGSITGATVEAINLAAKHAGISLRWQASTARPDDVLGDLESGVDLWPLVTVFPGREARFYATQPFGRAEYMIAVIDDGRFKGDKSRLKSYKPQRVAVSRGPWIQQKLSSDLPTTEPVFVPSGEQLYALCDGRADALVADAASLYSMTLQMPATCAGKRILDRLMEGWYWDLAIGSSFARSAEADRIRSEFGRLAREGALHTLFADYPIQAQYRSQDTFAETKSERERRITRAMVISLGVCSIALFGIVLETRRRASQAMKLVRMKSGLVDRISHELRTPLNGVLGLASLLAGTPLNPTQKEYLELIRQSGEQLLKLVNDSLMLSRLEAGHQHQSPQAVNVRQHLEDVASLLAPMAHDRNINLVWIVAPDVPAMVVTDGGIVRQLLINLGGNALKYTEQGTVSISVTVAGVTSGFPFLRFEVDDSGPGIPAEDRARVFESFIRLERPVDQIALGTGLGLAIAKELVILLGGQIGVEEGQFGGARFWFEFPVELPVKKALAADASKSAGSAVQSSPELVDPIHAPTDGVPARVEVSARAEVSAKDEASGASSALPHPIQHRESHPPRPVLLLSIEPDYRTPGADDLSRLVAVTMSASAATKAVALAFTRPGAQSPLSPQHSTDKSQVGTVEPVLILPTPTLEMASQHLGALGYNCFYSSISNLYDRSSSSDQVPDFLVLEYPTDGPDLRQLIRNLRERFHDPLLPVLVFCRFSAEAKPCEGKRPLAVRVMRVPFLSGGFDRMLKEAREEAVTWAQNTVPRAANANTALVPCDQVQCPLLPIEFQENRQAAEIHRRCLPEQSDCVGRSREQEERQPEPLRTVRVLVADDNPINRLVLCSMLRAVGAHCDEAVDGAAALAACEKHQYDMLFLDHHMPGKDGLEVTEWLRKQSDWRRSVPIVAVSAADTEVQQARYGGADVNAVLSKPFTRSDLQRVFEDLSRHPANHTAGAATDGPAHGAVLNASASKCGNAPLINVPGPHQCRR